MRVGLVVALGAAVLASCGGLTTGTGGGGSSGAAGSSGAGGSSGTAGSSGSGGTSGAPSDGGPPQCVYYTSSTDCATSTTPCWSCGSELYSPCTEPLPSSCSMGGTQCFTCGADGLGENYVCSGSPRNVWLGQSSMTCSGPTSAARDAGAPPFCVLYTSSSECCNLGAPCWACGTELYAPCQSPLPSSCTNGGSTCFTCGDDGSGLEYGCSGSPRNLWLAEPPSMTCAK
jgi:hypothetical protein